MIEIEIHELFSFFRHPQRYFFTQTLGIWFENQGEKAEEREPFAIGQLDGYNLYQEWLEMDLQGEQFSVEKLQARGLWTSGVVGELAFKRKQQEIAQFAERIRAKNLGEPLDDLAIDINIGSYRLTGKLSNRYENGVLLYRYAGLKGKDFIIALLHHLVAQQQQAQTTHLLSSNKGDSHKDDLVLLPDVVNAKQHLQTWLDIYQQGCQHPHTFFVEAAFEYVQQQRKLVESKRASIPALDAAKKVLQQAFQQSYEPEFQLLGRHTQDVSELLHPDFEQYCLELLQPVWNAVRAGDI
jgi:exodeoxyribonuclease V gamma subunit